MTESTHTSITSITSVMSSGTIQLGQEQQVRPSTAPPAGWGSHRAA